MTLTSEEEAFVKQTFRQARIRKLGSAGVALGTANTWTALQTFNSGVGINDQYASLLSTVSYGGLTIPGIAPTTANSTGWFAVAPSGTSKSARLIVVRIPGANGEALYIGSDVINANAFEIRSDIEGTGTVRPLIFSANLTTQLTLQAASPYVKFAEGSTGAGSAALGANSPAATVTAPYTWIKVASADGSTVYIPAWK